MTRLWVPLLLLLTLPLSEARGQSNEQARLEAERAALAKRIRETQQMLDQTRNERKESTREWAVLQEQLDLRQELLANLRAERRAAERQLDRRQTGAREADEQLNALKEEYADMIRLAAKLGGTDEWWMAIFDAEGLSQAFRRLALLEEYRRVRRAQADRITQGAKALRQEMTALEREKEALVSVESELRSERDAARTAARRMEGLVADFQSRESELRSQLKKEEARRSELGKAIERLMEEARRAERGNTGFASTPEGQIVGEEFQSNKGRLPWPVSEGVLVGRFGTQPHPSLPGIQIERRGIDIATADGSKVYAIFRGRVSNVITIPGGGMVVMVDHGSHRSVYANLASAVVTPGEDLLTGQAVGTVLDLGEGPKAHLEIWDAKGSTPLNPEPWIAR